MDDDRLGLPGSFRRSSSTTTLSPNPLPPPRTKSLPHLFSPRAAASTDNKNLRWGDVEEYCPNDTDSRCSSAGGEVEEEEEEEDEEDGWGWFEQDEQKQRSRTESALVAVQQRQTSTKSLVRVMSQSTPLDPGAPLKSTTSSLVEKTQAAGGVLKKSSSFVHQQQQPQSGGSLLLLGSDQWPERSTRRAKKGTASERLSASWKNRKAGGATEEEDGVLVDMYGTPNDSFLERLVAEARAQEWPIWTSAALVFARGAGVGWAMRAIPNILVRFVSPEKSTNTSEALRTGLFLGFSMSFFHVLALSNVSVEQAAMASAAASTTKVPVSTTAAAAAAVAASAAAVASAKRANDAKLQADDEEEELQYDDRGRRIPSKKPLIDSVAKALVGKDKWIPGAVLIMTPLLAFLPRKSRLAMALFVAARATEAVINGLLSRLSKGAREQLPVSKWLFALGNAQVVYCWLFHRNALPTELTTFLDKSSAFTPDTSFMDSFSSATANQNYEEALMKLQNSVFDAGFFKRIIGTSGVMELIASDVFSAAILFGPVFDFPHGFSNSFQRGARSAAVLAADVTLSGIFLLALSRLLRRTAPANGWWAGFAAGFVASLGEPQESRSVELALFVLTYAARALYNIAADRNIIPARIKLGEFALYFVSLFVLIKASASMPATLGARSRKRKQQEQQQQQQQSAAQKRAAVVAEANVIKSFLVLGKTFQEMVRRCVVPG